MTTLTFETEKTTKNTVKFSEVPVKGQPPVCGSLYVQKFAHEQMGEPQRVTVTIEPL